MLDEMEIEEEPVENRRPLYKSKIINLFTFASNKEEN